MTSWLGGCRSRTTPSASSRRRRPQPADSVRRTGQGGGIPLPPTFPSLVLWCCDERAGWSAEFRRRGHRECELRGRESHDRCSSGAPVHLCRIRGECLRSCADFPIYIAANLLGVVLPPRVLCLR